MLIPFREKKAEASKMVKNMSLISKKAFKISGRKPKSFRQAQIIKQVGAKPVSTKRGVLFKLGGGIFSKRQIIASRKRLVRIKAPTIFKKAVKGGKI